MELSSRHVWAVAQLGSIYGLMGREEDSRAILGELAERRKQHHVPALAFAWVNMGLGEEDRAVEWFERSYEEHEGWLVSFYHDPLVESLHDHPGFVDIFRRIGLPGVKP